MLIMILLLLRHAITLIDDIDIDYAIITPLRHYYFHYAAITPLISHYCLLLLLRH
jgi:hypothetical protein